MLLIKCNILHSFLISCNKALALPLKPTSPSTCLNKKVLSHLCFLVDYSQTFLYYFIEITNNNLHSQMKLKVGKSSKNPRAHDQMCQLAEMHRKSTLIDFLNLNANSFS